MGPSAADRGRSSRSGARAREIRLPGPVEKDVAIPRLGIDARPTRRIRGGRVAFKTRRAAADDLPDERSFSLKPVARQVSRQSFVPPEGRLQKWANQSRRRGDLTACCLHRRCSRRDKVTPRRSGISGAGRSSSPTRGGRCRSPENEQRGGITMRLGRSGSRRCGAECEPRRHSPFQG